MPMRMHSNIPSCSLLGKASINTLVKAGIIAIAVVVFGIRLIPVPEGDRAIYEAVGQGLLTGQRLYAEIYDNKDPLFFYAVALQRSLGSFSAWLFEAISLSLGGYSLAGLHRWLTGEIQARQEWTTGILGALLLSGGFWGSGQPQLPASALMLFSALLIVRGHPKAAGVCTGLMAGFKLIAMPIGLTLAFCLLSKQGTKERLQFTAGTAISAALLGLFLQLRHELAAYGKTLSNNFLYSQGVLIQPGTPIEVLASHARTLFLSGKNNMLMLAAVALAAVILWQAARERSARRSQLARAGLMALFCALGITTLTGLWAGHLQLLYPTQCLAVVVVVQGWKPQLRLQQTIRLPIMLIMTAFMSGTLDLLPTYWMHPPQIAEKINRLHLRSPEELALQAAFPRSVPNFARLGGNSSSIPVGLKGSHLTCAEFHQYGFYSNERLDMILECFKRSPVVLISPDFEIWNKPPSWFPKEAQALVIQKRWNRFVEQSQRILDQAFSCQRHTSGAQVCIKHSKS